MRNSKYLKVSEQLLRRAYGNGANHRLPSERRICTLFGVSRTTAKMALNHLKEKKLVIRREGSGTYFSPPSKKVAIRLLVPKKYSDPELISYFMNEGAIFSSKERRAEIEIEEFDENLLSAVNARPGVKILYSPYMGFLADTGVLVPLNEFDDFIETAGQLNSQHFQWFGKSPGSRNCYSMPLGFGADVFAFSRTKARALGLDADNGPADWDDILKWADVSSKGNVHPTTISTTKNYIFPHSYYYTLTGGEDFVSEKDGLLTFNFKKGAEWISFFRSIHACPSNLKYGEVSGDPLLNGETLFRHDVLPWIIGQSRKLGVDGEISIRQIPPRDRGGVSISKISRRELGIISDLGSSSSERKAAWDFMKHLSCDTESQHRMVKEFPSVAVNREVFDEQRSDPVWHPFIHALSTGISTYDKPANFGVVQVIRKYFFEAVNGKMSIELACGKINEICSLQLEMDNERRGLFV
ncbi:MAG TPA: hypothetical protein DCZ94_16085 [Lentisphaeria bacterium]|nr:MAG: hypothetical protein A2X48_00555 [Lentisphaerae bacterium GWF2_49_21]HBC88468.1 hypothetical protein [Lentisphaeria bacterium]